MLGESFLYVDASLKNGKAHWRRMQRKVYWAAPVKWLSVTAPTTCRWRWVKQEEVLDCSGLSAALSWVRRSLHGDTHYREKKQRRVEVKGDHCLKFIHISRCPSDRFTAHDSVYLASFMAHKPVGDLVLLSWSTATTWWPCKSICRATWCNKRSCLLQQNLQRPKKEVCNRNNVYIWHPFAICSK